MEGWIKLYRKTLENGILKDHTSWVIFSWLLLKVDRKTGKKITGRFWASSELGMKPTTFYKSLMRLQNKWNMVTLRVTGKYTEISLVNWDKYQNNDTSSNTLVTHQGHISDTLQEERIKNTNNNAEISEDGADLEKELELKKQGIQNEWQYFGIEMWKQLNAPIEKKGECIRIAKVYPRSLVTMALGFALDYPTKSLMWKMFIWKLNNLRKEAHEKSVADVSQNKV